MKWVNVNVSLQVSCVQRTNRPVILFLCKLCTGVIPYSCTIQRCISTWCQSDGFGYFPFLLRLNQCMLAYKYNAITRLGHPNFLSSEIKNSQRLYIQGRQRKAAERTPGLLSLVCLYGSSQIYPRVVVVADYLAFHEAGWSGEEENIAGCELWSTVELSLKKARQHIYRLKAHSNRRTITINERHRRNNWCER